MMGQCAMMMGQGALRVQIHCIRVCMSLVLTYHGCICPHGSRMMGPARLRDSQPVLCAGIVGLYTTTIYYSSHITMRVQPLLITTHGALKQQPHYE